MSELKKVAVISASPKINRKSVSDWLAQHTEGLLTDARIEIRHINVRKSIDQNQTENEFIYMSEADAMIIIFPLYVFCMPGLLTRFLQDYYTFLQKQVNSGNSAAVYTIINCGFPEPYINREAARVIKSFSEKVGADYRFSIMLGMGGMILGSQDAPFIKKALAQLDSAVAVMKDELLTGKNNMTEDIEIHIHFPKKLYFMGGDRGWISSAKKHGLRKKDMYAKPYI